MAGRPAGCGNYIFFAPQVLNMRHKIKQGRKRLGLKGDDCYSYALKIFLNSW